MGQNRKITYHNINNKKYFEFKFKTTKTKIIPFLDNGFAFDKDDEVNEKYKHNTPVISHIKNNNLDKIELLKNEEIVDLKQGVEKQILDFLKMHNENIWMKLKEAQEEVMKTKDPEKTITIDVEALSEDLDKMQNQIFNFRVFGVNKNNLLDINVRLPVYNPKLQELINQYFVLSISTKLSNFDLREDNAKYLVAEYSKHVRMHRTATDYFSSLNEHVLPYLDCPLNINNLKSKEMHHIMLFIRSFKYCFSVLYTGSMTPLGTEIKKVDLVKFGKEESHRSLLNTSKERLFHFLLFAQDRKNDYLLLNTPRTDDSKFNKVPKLFNLAAKNLNLYEIEYLNVKYSINTEYVYENNYLSLNQYEKRYKRADLTLEITLNNLERKENTSKIKTTLSKEEVKFLDDCRTLFFVKAFEDRENFQKDFEELISSLQFLKE